MNNDIFLHLLYFIISPQKKVMKCLRNTFRKEYRKAQKKSVEYPNTIEAFQKTTDVIKKLSNFLKKENVFFL